MKSIVLLCALSFSVGCGAQVPNTAPTTYTDYLKASSQLTCEATLACCGTVCSSSLDATFYQTAARTLDYINQGLTVFDQSAAQACLAALSQRYAICDAPALSLPMPPACNQVLVPKSPLRGQCDVGVPTCAGESTCVSGRCFALGKAGEPCLQGLLTGCASGFYCNSSTRICNPVIPAGQPCPTGMGCGTGAYCSLAGGTTLSCSSYGQSGQACDDVRPCDPTRGLQCSTAGVCQPQPVPQTIREQLCGLR